MNRRLPHTAALLAFMLVSQLAYSRQQAPRAASRPNAKQMTTEAKFEMLRRAFQLDEAQSQWLRAEIERRTALLPEFDAKKLRLLEKDRAAKRTPGNVHEVLKEYREHVKTNPLALEQIASALEPALNEGQREPGRRLLGDLLKQRRDERETKRENERLTDSALAGTQANKAPPEPSREKTRLRGKTRLRKSSTESAAPRKPAPESRAASARDRVRGPSAATRPAVAHQPGPTKPSSKGPRTGSPRATAAPESTHGRNAPNRHETATDRRGAANKPVSKPSEWEKIVAEYSARYHFTEAQKSAAQGILKDLERRADAYLTVHAADRDQAEKLADAKQRAAEMSRLDAPIQAMEQELRDRLEQIPTAEQRASAKGGAARGGPSPSRKR